MHFFCRLRLPPANKASPLGTLPAPQGKGIWPWDTWHRINSPQLWVKEVGQTGTTAMHNTQNGQKCCDQSKSPFETVHKKNSSPRSMIITQFARRRISVPSIPGRALPATPPCPRICGRNAAHPPCLLPDCLRRQCLRLVLG